MKIDRIELSLPSIAEERRREHREHPDTEPLWEHLEPEAEAPAPAHEAYVVPPVRVDDPTARLRVDIGEQPHVPPLHRAVEAFTEFDRTHAQPPAR